MSNSLWKQRNYLFLWWSQSFHSFAQVLLTVTVMIKVYTITGSTFGAASILTLMSIASFISGISASYLINNFQLKNVMFYVCFIRAFLSIILGFLFIFTPSFSTLYFLIILFAFSYVGGWYQPARFAVLPLVVAKEDYVKANGTLSVINQMLLTVGWAIGGLLTLYVSFTILISLIVLSFLVSGMFAKLILLKEQKKVDLKKADPAWKSLYQSPILRTITLMDMLEGLANAIWSSALLLSYTNIILHEDARWWGFLNAAYFVGAIFGSLVIVRYSKRLEKNVGTMIAVSALAMGVLTFAFSMSSYATLSLILCILMGPLYQIRDVCQETIVQDAIQPLDRARIMAARNAITTPWYGVTYLIMGYFADLAGILTTYISAAIIYTLTFILVFFQAGVRNYSYLQHDKKVKQDL